MKHLIYTVYSKAETLWVGGTEGGLKLWEPDAPAQEGDRLAGGPWLRR